MLVFLYKILLPNSKDFHLQNKLDMSENADSNENFNLEINE